MGCRSWTPTLHLCMPPWGIHLATLSQLLQQQYGNRTLMLCKLRKNNKGKMISFLHNSYRIYQVFQARDGHGKRREGVKCTWPWRSGSNMVGLELGWDVSDMGMTLGGHVWINSKWGQMPSESCNFILCVRGNHWDYSSRIGMGASQDSTKETECV